MTLTRLDDLIVPEVFTPYMQTLTEEKVRIIQAGAMVRDNFMDSLLAGAGLTFNVPSFRDLANEEENISSDSGPDSEPSKIQTHQEIAVRLSRNHSWGSADLNPDLIGPDPMDAIARRVAYYWARRIQAATVATVMGVFADNAKSPDSGDEHTQNDLTFDISGGGYSAGVTDISAEAVLDTAVTMGDSQEDLRAMMMHSIVYNRLQKNNLIDFIPDSRGEVTIPTFLGRVVVVDDGVPNPNGAGAAETASGIFHTWLFGPGALRFGRGNAKVPTETERKPEANQGAGEEVLHSRQQWALHPQGHAFIGDLSSAKGGPSNLATSNNLAHEDSWRRVFPERKQIKMARLITREF